MFVIIIIIIIVSVHVIVFDFVLSRIRALSLNTVDSGPVLVISSPLSEFRLLDCR